MDAEQTFIRVQERFSQILTPKVRAALEYIYLFIAITLFCILVVMHANYVQQPGCSSELSGVETTQAQIIQIKITSAGLWSQNESEFTNVVYDGTDTKSVMRGKLALKTDTEVVDQQTDGSPNSPNTMNIAGIHLDLDIPKWLRILHLDRLNLYAVQWLEIRSKTFEPTYLYTMEKGYFLLPESVRSQHNIRAVNISISARHSCFGNRWQQLLVNRFVGYDTILINSLLSSPGQGYLYNFQTKEFFNLSYAQEPPQGPARFGDYLVTKCGVLMMSLFVFFTTTMSVSFTLRETQTRMLKFTVQLQHHARHQLPTFQLIFVHVIESLVFVPIMIGILFFLFEFYDDQLLAFMVLILVWLSELFTLISVRTPISMKFFPRFFLIYFLVFHIYFFSYAYGFSYLALSTAAAFMLHLILYFWNRFEVPTLQRFIQNRRFQLQQNPDFHITSSTFLASTVQITRLNTRNPGLVNSDLAPGPGLRSGSNPVVPSNAAEVPGLQEQSGNDNLDRVGNPQVPGQADLNQAENGPNPGGMNSFSSLLLWILGGASSEGGLNSLISMFRDVREQGQVYAEAEPPRQENQDVHR
ncbi:membralin-like protein At1g60995 isoform X3 [Malus sylvestris]|uniref:membralin-like protein At1g60995 isoform X3 n=1 Tax=Malus domestica TaxID=3750 RepID=UPI0010AA28BA|nr:membralin-like protein At1g60995 isoform X4 [Malus domestica]XP_050124721.1 membralin-like protein At1g60995 isoform X3 [Malus sylvestris]